MAFGDLIARLTPLAAFAAFAPTDPARTPVRGAAFGPDPRHRLDVHAPASGRGPWPVAIFFYGGGWNAGDRRDYAWVGKALAARGFLALVPDYRLYPRVRFPAFLEDGALAVRWALENVAELGGNPGRLALLGHSAGAYNAAMLALDGRWLEGAGVDPRVVGAFAGLSGPYSFLPFDGPIAIRTFGEAPDPPATQPVNFVRVDAPPAFLATGGADTVVRPGNTRRLSKALSAAGARVEERFYQGLDHPGPVLALSRTFRHKAPVLGEMTRFLHEALQAPA